jgi:hypothetical protein
MARQLLYMIPPTNLQFHPIHWSIVLPNQDASTALQLFSRSECGAQLPPPTFQLRHPAHLSPARRPDLWSLMDNKDYCCCMHDSNIRYCTSRLLHSIHSKRTKLFEEEPATTMNAVRFRVRRARLLSINNNTTGSRVEGISCSWDSIVVRNGDDTDEMSHCDPTLLLLLLLF